MGRAERGSVRRVIFPVFFGVVAAVVFGVNANAGADGTSEISPLPVLVWLILPLIVVAGTLSLVAAKLLAERIVEKLESGHGQAVSTLSKKSSPA
jgi:hypothetical protein